MVQRPLYEAIPNFKRNEERADKFINGGENEDWVTDTGELVPTMRKLTKRIGDDANTLQVTIRQEADHNRQEIRAEADQLKTDIRDEADQFIADITEEVDNILPEVRLGVAEAKTWGKVNFASVDDFVASSLSTVEAPLGSEITISGVIFEVVSTDEDHTTTLGTVKVRVKQKLSMPSAPYIGGDVTDYATGINNAAYRASKSGGGIVDLPKAGTVLVKRPIIMRSDVTLRGAGGRSIIKADADFAIPSGQVDTAVVMSADFQKDRNVFFQHLNQSVEGLHINIGFEGIAVDASFKDLGVTDLNGVMLYGTYHWDRLEICNVWGHGLWTESGEVASLSSGTVTERLYNGRELGAKHTRIASCGLRGWWNRGPNDSENGIVVISQTDGSGLLIDTGENISAAGQHYQSIHLYNTNKVVGKVDTSRANSDLYMVDMLSGAWIDYLYLDAYHKGGLRMSGSSGNVGRVRFAYSDDQDQAVAPGLHIVGNNKVIGQVYQNEGNARIGYGGLLKVEGDNNRVDDINSVETITSEADWVHVDVIGNGNYVKGQLQGVPAGMTKMMKVQGNNNDIAFDFVSSGAVPSSANVEYNNASSFGNNLSLRFLGGHTGKVLTQRTPVSSDLITLSRGSNGMTRVQTLDLGVASPSTVSGGVLIVGASSTVYTPASDTNITSIVSQNGELPFVIIRNGSGANRITFVHDGANISGSRGSSIVLHAGESAVLYRATVSGPWFVTKLVGTSEGPSLSPVVSASVQINLAHNGRLITPAVTTTTLNLVAHTTVQYPIGYAIEIVPSGPTQLVVASGVTVNGLTAGSWELAPAPGSCRLIRSSENTWLLTGDAARN